jgi:hypothetical protein
MFHEPIFSVVALVIGTTFARDEREAAGFAAPLEAPAGVLRDACAGDGFAVGAAEGDRCFCQYKNPATATIRIVVTALMSGLRFALIGGIGVHCSHES